MLRASNSVPKGLPIHVSIGLAVLVPVGSALWQVGFSIFVPMDYPSECQLGL